MEGEVHSSGLSDPTGSGPSMDFELMYNSINYTKTNRNSSEFLSHRDDSKEFCPGGDAIYFPPEEEASFAFTGRFSLTFLIVYRCSLGPLWEHFF